MDRKHYGKTHNNIVFYFDKELTAQVTAPYGLRSWPRAGKWSPLVDDDAAEQEFNEQRARVWSEFGVLYPLAQRVFKRDLERLHDIGVPAIGFAVLTYDASRDVSLKAYTLSVLRFAARSGESSPNEQNYGHTDTENLLDNRDHRAEAEVMRLYHRATESLTPEQRHVLSMRYVNGMSYAKIADALGYRSRQTAIDHVKRALKICRSIQM